MIDLVHLETVSQIDWARLATLIDGEGCIAIKKRGTHIAKDNSRHGVRYWLDLRIANTDIRMPNWCHEIFGGAVYTVSRRAGKYRTLYAWVAIDNFAAAILRGCLPYFIIKREQAEVALAFRQTFHKAAWYGGIHPISKHPFKRVKPEILTQREQLHSDLKGMYCRTNNIH